MDKRIYNCVFCVKTEECDLEQRKDHAYNLRDGKVDCFVPHGETVPPWLNPFCDECYGCTTHTYDDCSVCEKEE